MKVWLPAIRVGTGVDVFTERLAEGLSSRGVEPVITWFSPSYEFLPELMRLRAAPLGVDVIHANSMHAHVFLGCGLPIVATVHHLVHDPAYAPYRSSAQAIYHNWHIRWRERIGIRSATAVTAVSEYVAGTVRSVFGRNDVEVVQNWVDTRRFFPSTELLANASRRFRILWVGNPTRRKGSDLLAPLAAMLGPRYEIRCVGGLRGGRSNRAPGEGLTWLGSLPLQELLDEYRQCDVLVSLSRYEGFGYTALEAMACSKPVVAFASGGISEVVQSGITGDLLETGDLDGLAIAIRRLASSADRRAELGEAGRRRAQQLEGCVDQYVALYDRVCAR